MAFTVDEIKRTVIPKARAYLLIDRGKLGGLVQYFSFVNELEDDFCCHVDVVTSGINDKDFLDGIIREGVLLYASD